MRSPKWPGECIGFQFGGINAVFLVEAFLPWELRPLTQQSLQLQGQKAKLFLAAPFPPLPARTGESWLGKTAPYVRCRIRTSWRTLPPTQRHSHLAGTTTKSSQGQSTVLSTQLLLDNGECAKTNEFQEHGWAHRLASFAVK